MGRSKSHLLHLVSLTSLVWCLSSCRTQPKTQIKDLIKRDEGLTLEDFSYEPKDTVAKELAARIGCKEAAKWVLNPQDPMSVVIPQLSKQKVPYDYIETKMFQSEKPCSPRPHKSNLDGITTLHKLVTEKGYGLTVIVIGGYGSHMIEGGTLAQTRALWTANLPATSFKTIRVECLPNSFATDTICAQSIQNQIEDIIEKQSGQPHLYLLWGYSKGGTTAAKVLAGSKTIRERVIGLVTAGSPFGGGVPMHVLVPLLEIIEPELKNLSLKERLIFSSLMILGGGIADMEDHKTMEKLIELLTPENLPLIRDGLISMLPSQKEIYLREVMPTWDLTRSTPHPITGKMTTPIFHLSSLADLKNLKVIPHVTIQDDESLAIDQKSIQSLQAAQLSLVQELARHPLSDMCVALEHSVIPEFAKPKGTTTELLALLKVDHINLGLADAQSETTPPSDAIVDSVIDALTQHLQGAQ